jgi:hypothetical protein
MYIVAKKKSPHQSYNELFHTNVTLVETTKTIVTVDNLVKVI